MTRNIIFRFLYKHIAQPIFFSLEPEIVHDRVCAYGKFLGKFTITRLLVKLSFSYNNKKLEQSILGIKFTNPIGLAAGFDKNGELTDIIPSVGFGFMEIGSITGESCEGNPKPRLWRLKKSKSLLVWYGLKNNGCEAIAKKLKNKIFPIPLGTNIAKTNSKDTVNTEKGIADYEKAFIKFKNIGSYYTINISCPNAFGGQPFTKPRSLDLLLAKIDKIPTKKPVFLKLSPDLTKKEIDQLIKVSRNHRVHGFICSNLTKNRKNKNILEKIHNQEGGMSGKVVDDLSNELISYLYEKTRGKYVIIGLGGVFSAKDAYKKIKLGASLVQLITGMIYDGPQVISEINRGLIQLIEADGYSNVREAIGASNAL